MDRASSGPSLGPSEFSPMVLAVSSGKGGVGKTNISVNLALALGKLGAKVLCVDADLGLANMDIVLGVTPMHTIEDIFTGQAKVSDVLVQVNPQVWLLPGASGQYDLANLAEHQRMQLLAALESTPIQFDYVIVDTGAGIGSNATSFAAAAQDIYLVVTPEPTSVADAYGMLKVLSVHCKIAKVRILVNQAKSASEAERVYDRLTSLCSRFLRIEIDMAGHIPLDPSVPRSVMRGSPFVATTPKAPASLALLALAERITASSHARQDSFSGAVSLFWHKLLRQGEAA